MDIDLTWYYQRVAVACALWILLWAYYAVSNRRSFTFRTLLVLMLGFVAIFGISGNFTRWWIRQS